MICLVPMPTLYIYNYYAYLYIPFAQVSIWLKEHPVEQQTATRHGSAIHLAGFCDHLGDHFGCYEMSWLSQLGPRIGPGGSYG